MGDGLPQVYKKSLQNQNVFLQSVKQAVVITYLIYLP